MDGTAGPSPATGHQAGPFPPPLPYAPGPMMPHMGAHDDAFQLQALSLSLEQSMCRSKCYEV